MLDPYVLWELVQAIYAEAPDKSSGKRRPLKTQGFQNFMLIQFYDHRPFCHCSH